MALRARAPRGVIDPENRLEKIDWRTREAFGRMAAAFTAQTGLALKVRSALRTCAEQYDLYGVGRRYNLGSKPITHARGCSSWHVLGRAVDADPTDPATGKRVGDCKLYTAAGEIWEKLGGRWGGRWSIFGECGDAGHFEFHPGLDKKALCPDPRRCEEAVTAIETVKPTSPLLWALGGFAVVGAVAWGLKLWP